MSFPFTQIMKDVVFLRVLTFLLVFFLISEVLISEVFSRTQLSRINPGNNRQDYFTDLDFPEIFAGDFLSETQTLPFRGKWVVGGHYYLTS